MSQRRNVRQTVRRVGIQIPQVSELIRRRSFNTTFSAIATLVTWKCFQALWFRWFYNIISKHSALAEHFTWGLRLQTGYCEFILILKQRILSGRFRLPLETKPNDWMLLASLDVNKCSLRDQFIRYYLENVFFLELREE